MNCKFLNHLHGCCGCSVASLVQAGCDCSFVVGPCLIYRSLLSLLSKREKGQTRSWTSGVHDWQVTGQTLTLTSIPSHLLFCSIGQLQNPSSSIGGFSSMSLYSKLCSLEETFQSLNAKYNIYLHFRWREEWNACIFLRVKRCALTRRGLMVAVTDCFLVLWPSPLPASLASSSPGHVSGPPGLASAAGQNPAITNQCDQ